MAVLKDIGELGISDSLEGGRDYVLRPSFEAMARLGEPVDWPHRSPDTSPLLK